MGDRLGKARSPCSNDYDFDRVRIHNFKSIIVFTNTRYLAHTKIVA
jgi:hypothetical protein